MLVFSAFGYYMYLLFFTGNVEINQNPTIETITPGSFTGKLQTAATALTDSSNKIKLSKKDLAFTETALFKSFIDMPEVVPRSTTRGREDPFVLEPYATP